MLSFFKFSWLPFFLFFDGCLFHAFMFKCFRDVLFGVFEGCKFQVFDDCLFFTLLRVTVISSVWEFSVCLVCKGCLLEAFEVVMFLAFEVFFS